MGCRREVLGVKSEPFGADALKGTVFFNFQQHPIQILPQGAPRWDGDAVILGSKSPADHLHLALALMPGKILKVGPIIDNRIQPAVDQPLIGIVDAVKCVKSCFKLLHVFLAGASVQHPHPPCNQILRAVKVLRNFWSVIFDERVAIK